MNRSTRKSSIPKIPYLAIVILGILFGINSCTWEKGEFIKSDVVAQTKPSSNNLSITASLAPSPRPLSQNFMCFNADSLFIKSWKDPDFWQAVKTLNPRMLRIPGGTESNYWDWQKGGLIENVREVMAGYPIAYGSRDREYTAGKLEDFQAGIKGTGTTPIFVLNMTTSDLKSQIEMLQTAKNLGMPVKYIELGNELYIDVENYRKVFPTPEDYAKTASQWASVIKQKFPEAEISVVGVIPTHNNQPRLQNWNNSLLNSVLPPADAIAIHIYPGHGLNSRESTGPSYPFFTAEDVEVILSQPFKNWQALKNNPKFQLIPENQQIWITEYNLFENIFGANEGKKPKVMGSWAHGMYVMAMSLLFLEDPRIEIICNHGLVGNVKFGAILAHEKGFLNLSDKLTTPLSLSATGSALRLLGDATEGMSAAQKIDFSNNPAKISKDGFKYSALYGWMFSKEQDTQGVIINLSDDNLNVDVSHLFSQKFNYEQLSGKPRTLVTGPGILTQKRETASGQVSLPAYSVTKLSKE